MSSLFLPDGDIVAVGERDFLAFFLHLPRTSRVGEIGCVCRGREARLPNENAGKIFPRGPVFLSIHDERSEGNAIIGKIVDGRRWHSLVQCNAGVFGIGRRGTAGCGRFRGRLCHQIEHQYANSNRAKNALHDRQIHQLAASQK